MKQNSFKHYLICVSIGLAGLGLSSCGVKTDVKVPDVKMPDMPDYKTMFNTCDKKDSEQPTVSNDVLSKKIVVEDQIDSKDLEYVDCEGKVTKTEHGPERDLSKFVEIEAPANLTEPVSYVSIENYRTCSVHRFDGQDSDIGGQIIELPDGKTLTTPYVSSAITRAGKMVLNLSDSTMKLNLYLNVHDGNNVLKVRYFGKCQKLKTEKDRVSMLGESYNCAEDREIASKDLLIEVQVNRPEVSGKKQIKVCDKK